MFKFKSCPLSPFSRVWLYLRDSGGDNQDLASQRAFSLAYCEHYRLQIIRLFEDSAISGGSTKGRDEFMAMIDLSRSGKKPLIDAILYWDTKRFARNQVDSQFFKADLRRRGYKLVSLSDDIPDNSFGPVFESLLEWKAQQDRLDLSKDIRRGMSYIVGLKDDKGNYLGIFPGAPPTFFKGVLYDTGIKRNDGKMRVVQRIIPDSDTWHLGQRAWQMRAERASYFDIEKALNLFPNNNNPASTYYHLFRNEIYIGRLLYSGQTYENFVPALATPEQWERVQALTYQRPKAHANFPADKIHPKAGRGDYLLSGLCNCIYCQSNIHGSTNRRRERKTGWSHYVCSAKEKRPERCPESKRIAARKIEPVIVDFIMSRVLTNDYVSQLAQQANALLSDGDVIQAEIDRQQRKVIEFNRAINSLIDTIELAPSPDLIARLKQRQIEREAARQKLEQLERQVATNSHLIDESLVLKMLTEMRSILTSGEIRARQLILQSAVLKIELGRNEGNVHYRFPLAQVSLERVNWLELNPVQICEFQF